MASAGAKTGVSVKQVIEDLITRCQTNQGTDQDHERMGRIYVVSLADSKFLIAILLPYL